MKIQSEMKLLSSGQHFPRYMSNRDQSKSHVNSPIWPKIEFVQDFMADLIPCKSDEDPIKNEIAIIRTAFSLSMSPSRVGNIVSC